MITRAYTNAADERQEISLSPAEWEDYTDEKLQKMLGFDVDVPAKPDKPAKSAKASG